MTESDLARLTELQKEIQKEAYSTDRREDLLWIMVEKLGQEVLRLRTELEKRHPEYRRSEPRPTRGKVQTEI
jgi:hypothetical protein